MTDVPVNQTIEHGASNTKVVGPVPRECKLWINASVEWVNVVEWVLLES